MPQGISKSSSLPFCLVKYKVSWKKVIYVTWFRFPEIMTKEKIVFVELGTKVIGPQRKLMR